MKENIYNKKTREKKAAMYAAPQDPVPTELMNISLNRVSLLFFFSEIKNLLY